MKKNILLLICFLFFYGCTSQSMNEAKQNLNHTELKEEEQDIEVNDVINEYIKETFAQFGYQTPDQSQWVVKYEGSEKVVVIIKTYLSGGKVSLNKLIFLWYGAKEDAKLLEVIVNDHPVYK